MYRRCIVLVADGARADLMAQQLQSGHLPNMQKHVVDRGAYRTALTVFPSTTGPAHIPFVCGIHPGTANAPGYRWLCRATHDRRRRSFYRHRSQNSPRGLMLGRDMDRQATSLFAHFPKPSSILELIDYCPNQRLYKIVARRLYQIVRAHKTDDWHQIDAFVERMVIKRIDADSHSIVASFFGIDEYSHLYSPFDDRTIGAYQRMDQSVGNIAEALQRRGTYDETILAIVSDHGLSATHTHIPVVDIVKAHGFTPHYYPKLYRRQCDSAVMESGNAMAAIYFRRGSKWGAHWRFDEMRQDPRIGALIHTLVHTEGVSFAAMRDGDDGVAFVGTKGVLRAQRHGNGYTVSVEGVSPLGEHPTGTYMSDELMRMTYHHSYPDAVNQVWMLFRSPRSGDIALSSEPGFDLRLQHEFPEHHSSHGSLHREHMHVPLAFSVPFNDEYVSNCDVVPTILSLCGKQCANQFDGRVWRTLPVTADRAVVPQ